MQKIIFTEAFCQPEKLFPFTLTRKVQDVRLGILTIREKWERLLGMSSVDKWEDDYKDNERSLKIEITLTRGSYLLVHGNVLPTPVIIQQVRQLKDGELLNSVESGPIAFRFSTHEIEGLHKIKVLNTVITKERIQLIRYPWDIFQLNDWALRADWDTVTHNRQSAPIAASNQVINAAGVFIEEGAKVNCSILNAATGPIYIGRNSEVMEGCLIRGPFALGEGSVLKMGTRVYGATTLGPYCVGGGEIKNSVLFGYSNKAHDGYLGDSVVGEWCNMGAGTSNSNIKNTASAVRVYSDGEKNSYITAGIKCGVLMGDYARSAINTSFNTGTVVGVAANVFGNGLTPKFIPNFSWGAEGISRYRFEKAMEDIESWKQLKNKTITEEEKSILKYIYGKL